MFTQDIQRAGVPDLYHLGDNNNSKWFKYRMSQNEVSHFKVYSIKTVKDTKNFIVTQERIYKIIFVILF